MTGPQGIHGAFTTSRYGGVKSAVIVLNETSKTTDIPEGNTMKRFILIAVLAGALAALLAGTALAAGPVTPPAQGFGPGMGMRAAAAGSTAPDADHPCGMGVGMSGEQGRGAPAWAGQPDEVVKLLGMTRRGHSDRTASRQVAGGYR